MRPIGIYYAYWTDSWEADFFPFIPKVKALGFDQLEINGGALVRLTKDQRQRLKESAEENKISLSYGIGLTANYDVSSRDERIRREGVNFMKRMIQAVSEMGGGMIGGTVHSYWPASPPESLLEKEEILKKSHQSMLEMIPLAEDSNVILNVEVINRFEQFLLNTCQEAVAYVEKVNSPNCKILLDTFHMNIEEDSFMMPLNWLAHTWQPFIWEKQIENLPDAEEFWAEIKTALDEIDFNGPLVMEPFIRPGGQVGKDIALWRELMPGADLDREAAKSVEFVRKTLCH